MARERWAGSTISFPVILTCFLTVMALSAGICGAAGINITSTPKYGEAGAIKGSVSGVTPADYQVLVYINVEDTWWTKPDTSGPATAIGQNRKWTCNIGSGDSDKYTQSVAAFLVPKGVTPTVCSPCYDLPRISQAAASTVARRGPAQRTLSFSGYKWQVKRRDFKAGPGPNRFSDSAGNVWKDNRGLHLKINSQNGAWYSAEVINTKSLGYGVYAFTTNSRLDTIDPMAVAGFFTYDTTANGDAFREIDFEYSRWGAAADTTNAQYAVQPCASCPGCGGNCDRFAVNLPEPRTRLTHFLNWQPGRLEFRTYLGSFLSVKPLESALVKNWTYTDAVPVPGNEKFRINHWLFQGASPINGQPSELIVEGFAFMATPPWNATEPSITITAVSPYGAANGTVRGTVANIQGNSAQVAVYIQVAGVWWTKPFFNKPFTSVNGQSRWACDITTGGDDRHATAVAAFLVPRNCADTQSIIASGASNIPQEIYDCAYDHEIVER